MVATFYGILIVILALLLAVGGLALVEYLVPWQVRQRHNDVAGFIYAVLGVVYAVWLGFVTIAVWEDFEAARSTAHSEANELAELFWLAHELPLPQQERREELANSYAKVVIDDEWSLMAKLEFRCAGPGLCRSSGQFPLHQLVQREAESRRPRG